MGETPESGEGQLEGGKTLTIIPSDWDRVEGATRPPEWKTLSGKIWVMEWLEGSSCRGKPKPPRVERPPWGPKPAE